MNSRKLLIQKILELADPGASEKYPVVSVDDFFSGNEDEGSIGCNLDPHPGIEKFHQVFKEVEKRSDVASIQLMIYEIEPESDGIWPFSDRALVVTTAESSSVGEWFAELEPDEQYEETELENFVGIPPIPEGYKVVTVWWD